MNDRALWRPWMWLCPPLAVAGWLCTAPAVLALLEELNAALRGHDGPGVPGYLLVLAVAGLVLDVAAVLWSVRQLGRVVRRRAPLDGRGLALAAVLALTVVASFYQWQIAQITHDILGPHHYGDSAALPTGPQ
ncbi:hypothetical protein ACIQF6_24955 [Kitasatospora sp. NPDC092948]|uniref:hypothetical protein n=1 Tax=Kitasatospora sp. NPDC092948 TaxID=3364088 RepID=UPI0038093F9B